VTRINLNAPATLELRGDWREQHLQGPDTIRFETAAEAIKFAVESLDPYRLKGAVLTTDEGTLSLEEMRVVYERAEFPLSKGGVAEDKSR
jgi:hypothetical protein